MTITFTGVILAAGFGSRLKPITDYWPKPLVPFLGICPLAIAYHQMITLGIDDIWINTHYKHDQFPSILNALPKSPNISHEISILGTGGFINPIRNKTKNTHFIITNGDVIADFNLKLLLSHHLATKAAATMALLPKPIPGESSVWVQGQKIVAISKSPIPSATPMNFACAQVLSPEFIDLLPNEGSFDIISQGYLKAISKNLSISYCVHDGFWFDIGTPKSFFFAAKTAAKSSFRNQVNLTRSYLGIPPLSTHGPIFSSHSDSPKELLTNDFCVIEHGSVIGSGCLLQNTIVLPGGIVSSKTEITNSIIGPFGSIPIDT